MQKKFKIITLGCRANQYESEKLRTQLEDLGLQLTPAEETADLVIVNSCSVTETALNSSIAKAKAYLKSAGKIVVTGCGAESDKDLFEALDPSVQVISHLQEEKLVQKLFPKLPIKPFSGLKSFGSHTRAFIKVQEGCNNFCSYCIIPQLRGRSHSRSVCDVTKEVKGLVAQGYKEIVLTGINLGDYKEEKEGFADLADLIEAVTKIEGLKRLRLSSLDPEAVTDKLVKVLLNSPKVMPSLHLVLQSGSDVILKKMRRSYDTALFLEKVSVLQKAKQNFTFTTDLIVGFPQESEADFQKSLEMIEKVKFAKVHIFPFSIRKKTLAAQEKKFVESKEIKRRVKIATAIAEKNEFLKREAFLDRELTVLVESKGNFGRSENFLKVKLLSKVKKNELVKVKIVKNTKQGLVGEIL